MSILNRQAHFNYTILDTLEAGLVLTGSEVKSIRAGQVSLQEAFAKIRGGEAWLINCHIAPYKQSADQDLEPTRARKLLLSKKEITSLDHKLSTEGLTLVPLKFYFKKNRVKVELGLGRGKKKFDKRETIKRRETERETRRKIGKKM
nr:hypothetical protein [uncultured bacterium]